MIRILLVDDQKTIREALRICLNLDPEMTVVGTASDGYTAIEQVDILKPDLVLIDIEMPHLDGFTATRLISQKKTDTKVLILSMHKNDDYVSQSLAAGAVGYLLKSTPEKELRESIRFIFKDYFLENGPRDQTWSNPSTSSPQYFSPPPIHTQDSHAENLKPPTSAQSNSTDLFIPPALSFDHTPSLIAPFFSPRSSKFIFTKFMYGMGALTCIAVIWGVSLLYLRKTPPTFTSEWSITLPSSGFSAFVNLPDIGQATSSNESPYNTQASDPRETYKSIMMTDEVIQDAARSVGIPPSKFGKPRVKVVLNTTLMTIELTGSSPQNARDKALALHEAFEKRLSQLRIQEVSLKDQGLDVLLEDANQKLSLARRKLTEFQTRTGLESSEQLRDLSQSAELLRRQQAEASAELEQVIAKSQRLSSDLGLRVDEVSDAFSLESDGLFQQYLTEFNQASANVVRLTTLFNRNHPAVLDQIEVRQSSLQALLNQGKVALGKNVTLPYLRKISIRNEAGVDANREQLFQDLISLKNEERGLQERSREIARQIQQFEQKLKVLSSQNSTLSKLERDVKIAEAIFSSTLTRQDLSIANQTASYPPVSVITQPNLPNEPSSPKPLFVYAAAVLSSLLVCSGTAALWWRSRQRSPLPSAQLPYTKMSHLTKSV